jgi:hypothetical protein
MMNAGDVINDALRKIGVAAQDEPATADQVVAGLRALNRLLRSMQNRQPDLWLVSSQDIALSNLAAQNIGCCARAVRSARLVRTNGTELPMQELTRQEYDDLPNKASAGTPTTYYYDRQLCDGTIYVWPVLRAPAGEVLRITYERKVNDAASVGATVDMPDEWEEALVYGLAARLADDYGVAAPSVVGRAEEELRLVLSRDREGSIFFHDARG